MGSSPIHTRNSPPHLDIPRKLLIHSSLARPAILRNLMGNRSIRRRRATLINRFPHNNINPYAKRT